jgi:hypothetical protein
MHTYNIKFIIDENAKNEFDFISNEKPFKGEVYTIEETNGKLWDVKVSEVKKIIIRKQKGEAIIEYRCNVEENKTANVIGFGKS